MSKYIEKRLKELNEELQKGQKAIADLDRQRAELRDTILRITGAIQALEEAQAEENKGK